ncbi:MAG TPA: hypothetical protein PLB11_09640 [Flavobacterium sp.]|nr:hypothetical protein [Flavobacterium sp.]
MRNYGFVGWSFGADRGKQKVRGCPSTPLPLTFFLSRASTPLSLTKWMSFYIAFFRIKIIPQDDGSA